MTWDPYGQQQPQHPPQQPPQPQSQPPQWRPEQYNPDAHYQRAAFQRPPQQDWQQPQYPPPGHRQPPRKRNTGKIIAASIGGFFLLIIVIAIAANGGGKPAPAGATGAAPPAASQPAAAPAVPTRLEYQVSGSAANVTYGPAGSGLSAHTAPGKPMDQVAVLGNALYYSLTAQLDGSGTVTCKILIGNKVISTAVASGAYQIAMCEISKDPLSGQWTATTGS